MRRAILGAALVAALAAPAAASPKLTVDVDGDDTGLVKRTVKRVLAEAELERPLIIYGAVEKTKKKGKKKVTIRLTVTSKDGTVLGELRVEAATREAAAKRAARKLPDAIALAKNRPAAKPARPANAGVAAKAKPASPKVAAKAKAKAKPAPESEDEGDGDGDESADSESESSESDSGSSSASESDGAGNADLEASSLPPPEAGGTSWLSLAAGPELVARHFSYRDDVFQELRQYDLAGAAALGVTADAYPLGARRDWLAGLGGAARLWYARPFDSDAANGESYRSASHGWAIGGRWRRTVSGIDVAAALDLGSQAFTVDAAGSDYESMVPAVSYTYLRPGVSGRYGFMGRYTAELSLGYRHVLSAGEIASEGYFPRLSARGFDLEGQLTYALWSGFDVRAGAGLEQYGFDLNPEPGDARVAGGATDRYPRLFLRVGYTR